MAKRTGDIELAGVLTTPAGASSGLAGEDLSLTAGAGNTTGVGGNVILTSGAGGATSGVAGDIALTVGTVVSGDGGNITLSGGAGDAGGDITLDAGGGGVAGGGDVYINGGDSAGTSEGGRVDISAGYGGATGVGGAGGPINITAGRGFGTAGAGGDITLDAGVGSGTGSAGAVVIPDSLAPTAPANKLYSVGGVLSWNGTTLDTGGGGISAVVEDTTPQLGGALDGQGFAITDATYPATINAQVGVTYTAVLADADKIITLTNAAAIAMTIPANASVAYPIGTKLNFQQLGAGAVTVGITSDTLLINAGASLVLNGQNSIATALKITATSWMLFGQLVPAFPPLTSVAISDLDDGTDGELITWDASGVATTVPAGTATQVLTSNGAGAEPTFQTVGAAGSAANLATTGADVNVDLSAPPTTGQVLVATSATTSTWQTPAATGIANVVEDTTPQLGGNLDVQSFSLVTAYNPAPNSIDLLPGNHVPGYAGEGGTINLTAGDGHYLSGSGTGQVNITGGANGSAAFSGHVNITGGANDDYRGQGYGTGGNVVVTGGAATSSAHAGDIVIQGGNAAGAGDGGDITLQAGTTSSGSTGAVVIPNQTAPTVTTNKLYSIAGALTWNGTDLTAGGGVTNPMTADLDVGGYAIISAAGVAATNAGDAINITAGAGNTTGTGGGVYSTAGAGGATGNGGGNYISGGDGGATSGNGGNISLYGGTPVDGSGGWVSLYAGSGYGTDQAGGALYFASGSSQGTSSGGPISIFAGSGGATGAGGAISINAGDGGATSGAGGDVTIIAGEGDTADNNGVIALETGTAGNIETIRGYIAANSTSAAALIATIPLTSGDSSVFEVFAVARQDSGTESAAFRIFGAAENTGGTAALIGSTAKDRTDDGGVSVDWDVVIGVSTGNLTITLDNDAETVDWKIKVRLTEL